MWAGLLSTGRPPSQQAANFVIFAFCTLLLVLGLPKFFGQTFELFKVTIRKYNDKNCHFIVLINVTQGVALEWISVHMGQKAVEFMHSR